MSTDDPLTQDELHAAESSKGSARTWSGWFAEVQTQATDVASKARELAAVQAERAAQLTAEATKAAREKAEALAKQASELREKYDMELATSVLMTTMGVGGSGSGSASANDVSTPSSANGYSTRKKGAAGGSGGRNPLQLDLEYMTENVIGMAFPYDPRKPGAAQQGGNDINAVSSFLRKNHQGHFMVWNISEETYDASLFADQVLEYKFPGHPAPPLGLLFKICTSVESWLDADDENVAVVHCLTGKGRTAALVACILTWLGEFSSPQEALQYVAERKGISVDYLTIPSQRRYVQYFSNMLDGVKPRSEPLLLRRVIINAIPVFGDAGSGGGGLGCCPYLQLFKGGRLIATATPPDSDSPRGAALAASNNSIGGAGAAEKDKKMALKWVSQSEGCVSFSVDCAVQGDILLRCRHADQSTGARVSMFRAAFHTGYAPSGVLRLTKAQLDGSVTDPRFSDDFFIDLIFAPIEKSGAPSSSGAAGGGGDAGIPANAIGIVGEPSDSGLVIDASSSDRYEMTLHRDTRFWDAVSARKLKSKRRRSRKFLSSSSDQFSIGDDLSGHSPSPLRPVRPPAPPVISRSAASMSDEELIMQLAKAEEDEDLGDGDDADENEGEALDLQTLSAKVRPSDSSSSSSSSSSASSSAFSSSSSAPGPLEASSGAAAADPDAQGDTAASAPAPAPAPASASAPASGSTTAAAGGLAELQALEDLEKELGLDDLQLFTGMQFGDSSASASASSPASASASGAGAEPAASAGTDDDLDELEAYLQSISK